MSHQHGEPVHHRRHAVVGRSDAGGPGQAGRRHTRADGLAGVLGFVLLIAQMIPAVIMAMGFNAIYLALGTVNSVPGLIVGDPAIAVPFGVLVFTAFMSGIPAEVVEAAEVDGASALRIFWSIIVPLSRNAIITVSLFAFLWAWSDFVFASPLDRGGDLQPITLGIYRYIGNNNQEWNAIDRKSTRLNSSH